MKLKPLFARDHGGLVHVVFMVGKVQMMYGLMRKAIKHLFFEKISCYADVLLDKYLKSRTEQTIQSVFREHMEETTDGLRLMTSSIFFPGAIRSQLNPVTPPWAQSRAWDSVIFFLFLFLVPRETQTQVLTMETKGADTLKKERERRKNS